MVIFLKEKKDLERINKEIIPTKTINDLLPVSKPEPRQKMAKNKYAKVLCDF